MAFDFQPTKPRRQGIGRSSAMAVPVRRSLHLDRPSFGLAALQRALRLWAMPLGFEARNGSATPQVRSMCNLYSITTNQAAIIALFRVMNRCVGNLPPMPGVFPDYPAPVVTTET
jgi:hypothetical protein